MTVTKHPHKPIDGDLLNKQPVQDSNWLNVRIQSDGTIANAETVVSAANSNGRLENGLIDVQNVPVIWVYSLIEFGTGPLTQVDYTFQFSDSQASTWAYLSAANENAGALTLDYVSYVVDTDLQSYIFPVVNPGACFMRILMASTGTITGSFAAVKVARAYTPPFVPGL